MPQHPSAKAAPSQVTDPVCGMTISREDALGQVDHWAPLEPNDCGGGHEFSSVSVGGNALGLRRVRALTLLYRLVNRAMPSESAIFGRRSVVRSGFGQTCRVEAA